MSNSECGVDKRFAADLKSQLVRELKDSSSPRLQALCEAHDQPIRQAWETIQRQMELFKERKNVIFATLREVAGEETAREVIRSGLDGMVPPTYLKIVKQLGTSDKSSGELPTPVTSPGITPGAAAGLSTTTQRQAEPSSPTPAGPVERRPIAPEAPMKTPRTHKTYYAKRTHPQSDQAARSAKKSKPSAEQVQTKNEPIDWWEVEGTEYIFQYPPFGPGWFVLRCDLGLHTKPHSFTTHPFQAEAALQHYNGCSTCKGHDSSRSYEPNDIVMNYGYRVRGDNVDQEWVAAANSRLEAENARTAAAGKGRARKQPEVGPANRSTVSASASSTPGGSLFVE